MARRSGNGPPGEIRSPGRGCALETNDDDRNAPRDNRPRQQEQDAPVWQSALFPVRWADGSSGYRLGCSWRTWSIVYLPGRWYRVVHQPSGRRLTEFDRLAIARRFCERIDPLADWSVPDPSTNPALGIQLHLAACAVTDSKPGLIAIKGGAP